MRYIAIAGCLLLLSACTRPRNTSKLLPPVPAVQSGVADHDTDGGDASPLDALHYYLLKRLPEGATEISPDWFVEAQRHIALMPRLRLASEPAAAGLSWTQLGPGNIGGRTRSLLINPQNTNIMYAGAVTGGIWKTVDGGLNWSLLTDPSANITVGPANLYPGLTVPAQAGNLIELYGTGFGPTNPTTNFGQTFSGAPPTVNTVTCTIGGVPATVQFAGLVAPGEYQLNIVVPPGLPPGDNLLVLTVGGVTTQANAYLAVQ